MERAVLVNTSIIAASSVSIVAFGAATVVALRSWLKSRHSWREPTLLVFAAAMTLYVFASASNVLEYTGINTAIDVLEDPAELLFIPLIVVTVYSSEVQARVLERTRSAHFIRRQNEMLMGIVDTSPSGVMVVAPSGHVIFANRAAEDMLRLPPGDTSMQFRAPTWDMRLPSGASTSLAEFVTGPAVADAERTLVWPDGRRADLRFTVTPMSDSTEQLGGALIAVERNVTAASG